jgi:hypothetical protein
VQNLPVALRGKTLDFFPETPEVIETAAHGRRPGTARCGRPACRCRPSAATARRHAVVLAADGEAYRAELKVLGTWPTVAAAATVSPALEAALKANAAQASARPCFT